MLARQLIPVSLATEPRRGPSHLKVAVGLSIGMHAAVAGYVAMMKFEAPPAAAMPAERILVAPWIVDRPPPPPPPEEPQPRQRAPTTHDPVSVPNPPISPLHVDDTPAPAAPAAGPVNTFDPPAPVADPPRPRDPIIRDPTWVRRPDAGDFARFYPERALRMEVHGEAELTCQVAANGQVRACRVTGETPANYGFGAAALKLSRYLQIAPKTVDGQPVDGGTLVVPISFRLK